jgi:hypothetical protein
VIAKLNANGYEAYVATGEVTSLEHELGNDTMELAALVVLALRTTFADGSKVLGGLGDDVVEEHEIDAAFLSYERISSFSLRLGIEFKAEAEELELRVSGEREPNLPTGEEPLLVTLPEASTSTSGPVHSTSKKTLERAAMAAEVEEKSLELCWLV